MKIQYAISLWNYAHYAEAASLEEELGQIREAGYGVELWGWWRGERYLYGVAQRADVQAALGSMPVSLHSSIVRSLPEHRAQIDAEGLRVQGQIASCLRPWLRRTGRPSLS